MISYEKLKSEIEDALVQRGHLLKRKGLLLLLLQFLKKELNLIEEDIENERELSLLSKRQEAILDKIF